MRQNYNFLQKGILVPTDFSEQAAHAYRYAESEARTCRAPITLLHVLEPMRSPLLLYENLSAEVVEMCRQSAEQQANEALTEAAREHFSGHEIISKTISSSGDIGEAIANYAQTNPPSIIVMGSHGKGFWGRLFLGSVALHVARFSNVPLMLIPAPHPESRYQLPFRKIAFCTDFSAAAEQALPFAVSIAHSQNAALSLVHVLEQLNTILPHGTNSEEERNRALQESYTSNVERKMRTTREAISQEAGKVEVRILPKELSISQTISDFAAEETDLIITATRMATDGRGWLGGFAEKLVHQLPCPILIIPVAENQALTETEALHLLPKSNAAIAQRPSSI